MTGINGMTDSISHKIQLDLKSGFTIFLISCFAISVCHGSAIDNDTRKKNSRLRVYWIGHSLMDHVADSSFGQVSVIDMVGIFARHSNQKYRSEEQAIWGASLSLQWTGKKHSRKRKVPNRAQRTKRFLKKARKYDVLILTESVPIASVIEQEYSSYYLRNFYCGYLNRNSSGNVYLYESWDGLQKKWADPNSLLSLNEWREKIISDRAVWDKLVTDALIGNVKIPPNADQAESIDDWRKLDKCEIKKTINVIPVASAMETLSRRMNDERTTNSFKRTDGSEVLFTDLFSNPYVRENGVNLYSDTGRSLRLTPGGEIKLRNTENGWDDIHPSATGVYFAALVVYSAIFQESPVGLPQLKEIGDKASKAMQEIAMEAVQESTLN